MEKEREIQALGTKNSSQKNKIETLQKEVQQLSNLLNDQCDYQSKNFESNIQDLQKKNKALKNEISVL